MTLADLEFVVILARAGSQHAAAQVLGVSRPAVSQRLARLERRLGAALVLRVRGRVILTPAGHVLHARARTILADMSALPDQVQRAAGLRRLRA